MISRVDTAVQDLSAKVWSWRTVRQPRSRDDIPRLERPAGWLPVWTPDSVANDRSQLEALEGEHRLLNLDDGSVTDQVDHALIGSALARVRWELDVLQSWRRQPGFYVDQSIGVVFDLLVVPPPFDESRINAVVMALNAVSGMLEQGKENLDGEAVGEFAAVTIEELSHVEEQLRFVGEAIAREFPASLRPTVLQATQQAGAALAAFRDWLTVRIDGMRRWEPVGRERFAWLLRNVALTTSTPEWLLQLARLEHARAVSLSVAEATRPLDASPPTFSSVEDQVRREADDEAAVRAFYVEQGILGQPHTLGHYLTAAMPAYLAPLKWLGVTDDLTGESRVDEDGVSYMPEPSPDLPYFYAANARDPRAGIVHEGAHYQQLALSWRHDNPVRRRYYDSGPNEGIAFYNEELMLQAGLFDNIPASRSLIYSFMRLRALRVEVDVRLALGELTIDAASNYFANSVPMDIETASAETAFFAAFPGQALTYQSGKTEIQRFLADAVRVLGDSFNLQEFHDYLWLNGNVPISLQRYEYLGLTDEWEILSNQ